MKFSPSQQYQHNRNRFPVIALCGSAGSLQELDSFFKDIPTESGCCFVIVMHLLPSEVLDISQLVRQFTRMPVMEAKDGLKVERNKVYVIPPMQNMAVNGSRLFLFDLENPEKVGNCIDFFLKSLAESHWNKAAAIIFSGLGTDGQEGIGLISQRLGLTIAQEPGSARYGGMPKAAIESGCIDLVLHAGEMAKHLLRHFRNRVATPVQVRNDRQEQRKNIVLQKILLSVRSLTGHDFTMYKTSTVTRRVERRMATHRITGPGEYLGFISNNHTEADFLVKEMLIGVTKFFRDPESFEALAKILNKKLDLKQKNEKVRIWIAGCSTGEETYSVAILILEYLKLHPHANLHIQIFATDLDETAIDKARQGWYDSRIEDDVSALRRKKYFTEHNGGYLVNKELRDLVIFAKHSLINDAPFTKLDLLCCRNVMIYFSGALQKKLFPVFHYSLSKKGILFLGPAETIGQFEEVFDMLNPRWRIFQRKDIKSNIFRMMDFPFNVAVPNLKAIKTLDESITRIPMTNSFHKILIDRYTPATLLLNERGDILYINGDVNEYLSLQAGEAALNVSKVLKAELRNPVSNAVRSAWQYKKSIPRTTVKLDKGDLYKMVAFTVDYLHDTDLSGLLIATFIDLAEEKKIKKRRGPGGKSVEVEELESELSFTKQQLTSTIEQMESSVEELKSTNEELQSANEELQSTNEEALTTKEEMQSLNEELMTINMQHQAKTEELTRLNNDMKNLLDNTEIGTVFLDNHLKILRFTPQITKLFNVIPQDVGRPITHIVSNFDFPGFEVAVNEVIERLAGKEVEISTKKGEWYNLRIMPYRTLDNFINGAVLAFTKITPLKSLEDKLESLRVFAQGYLEGVNHASILLSGDQRVLGANKMFLDLFKLRPTEILEQSFLEVVLNRWKAYKLQGMLQGAEQFKSCYLEQEFKDVGLKKLTVERHRFDSSQSNKDLPFTLFFKEHADEQQGQDNL